MNALTKDQAAAKLREGLPHYMGGDETYRHPQFKRFTYTQGVQFVAETAGAYWLLDVVFSHQIDPKVSREEFQVWTLTVRPDNTATATCTDGGKHGHNPRVIVRQEIEYSDFPLPKITFYLEGTVLLLPSEH